VLRSHTLTAATSLAQYLINESQHLPGHISPGWAAPSSLRAKWTRTLDLQLPGPTGELSLGRTHAG